MESLLRLPGLSRSMLFSVIFHALAFTGLSLWIGQHYEELKSLAPKGVLIEMGTFTPGVLDKGPGITAVKKAAPAPKIIPNSEYYHKKDKPHPETNTETNNTQVEQVVGTTSSSIGNATIGSGVPGLVGDPNGTESSPAGRYLYELKLTLEQRKVYPTQARIMGQSGKVMVRFVINKDGTINNAEVIEPSPFSKLNEAALKLIQNVKQFKPIPSELGKDQWTLSVPIQYSLN